MKLEASGSLHTQGVMCVVTSTREETIAVEESNVDTKAVRLTIDELYKQSFPVENCSRRNNNP